MAWCPNWTELRLGAAELVNMQKKCYKDVHNLLDCAIPELDRKLKLLHPQRERQVREFEHMITIDEPNSSYELEADELDNQMNSVRLRHAEKPFEPPYEVMQSRPTEDEPCYTEIPYQNGEQHHVEEPHHYERPQFVEKPQEKVEIPIRTEKQHETKQTHRYDKLGQVQKTNNTHRDQQKSKQLCSNGRSRDYDLEHLRPLPMPLCEYLKLNRPDVVRRADLRAMRLKKQAERRKFISSTKTINALEHIRLSSRTGSNYNQARPRLPRSQSQTYSVNYKLSEKEMKRLTAKTYKRLPEVKRKRKEEVSNHMRVQNYKNKLEYGRKLLENRKLGIINYPLRSSYDDSSVSSQDFLSMNGYGRADVLGSDPYY